MIMNYNECLDQYGNSYQINKMLESGCIFKIEEGIYSENKYASDVVILSKKYPHAVFSGAYAMYYHGLTEFIPDSYTLATKSKAAPITDKRVEQVYIRDEILLLGATKVAIDGVDVLMYDKERLLIELLRNKSKWPRDFYKEVIGHYRRIIDSLEIWRIQDYIDNFPKGKMIRRAFDEEVL